MIPIPRLNDYNRGIERLNIEQSIKNKVQTLDLCVEFLQEQADQLVAIEEISDKDDSQAFWLGDQGKKAQALAHIAQVRARWQGLLDHMDEPINQHAHLLLAEDAALAERDEALFEALLRREIVVSYKQEVAKNETTFCRSRIRRDLAKAASHSCTSTQCAFVCGDAYACG